jgi:hypothetical protein
VPQPARAAFVDRSQVIAERPAKGGLSGLAPLSPPSHFAIFSDQITESLQPTPRIFPFSRGRGLRLGSIAMERSRLGVPKAARLRAAP